MLFYIPTPLLMLALAGLGLWALRRRQRRMAIACALLAGVNAVFVAAVENHLFTAGPSRLSSQKSDSALPAVRVVHWNVYAGTLGWTAVRERLLPMAADAYVLSEAPYNFSADDFPGYSTLYLDQIALAVHGELTDVQTLRDSLVGQVYLVTWRSEHGHLRLMLADFASSLRVHRHPQLADLNELIALHQPDLVIGDFNAPRRSIALTQLPPGYAHAYDSAGSGWSYTWPAPAPVYAIDQFLHGPRVRAMRHELFSTPLSDHRLQEFEFQLLGDRP